MRIQKFSSLFVTGLKRGARRWIYLMAFGVLVMAVNHYMITSSKAVWETESVAKNHVDRRLEMVVATQGSQIDQEEGSAQHSDVPRSKEANVENPPFERRNESIVSAMKINPSHHAEGGSSTGNDELELRYRSRNERVDRICQERGVVSLPTTFLTFKNASEPVHLNYSFDPKDPFGPEIPITSHFALVPAFQTMGCFLNKVASSSLVSAFLIAIGLGPTFTSPHSLVNYLFPRSLLDFQLSNATFFKFMFVRHPMDRMLSCYLDKMVDSPHFSLPAFRTYVKNRARAIITQRKKTQAKRNKVKRSRRLATRRKTPPDNELNRDPAERADWVSTVDRANVSQSNVTKPLKRGQLKPTFEEFLEFVLDSELQGVGYDAHWVPYHRYCTPCSVKYHVIGKLETGVEDFNYVWNKTGLKTTVPIPWVNRNTGPSEAKIQLEKRYYSSLPRHLILRFYKAFRMDFELFDYSIDEILQKAGYKVMDANEMATAK